MKHILTQEYLRRTRKILETELNAKNKVTAITTLATPVIQYSYGIVKWTLAEIRNLDRKTRKLLNMKGALHPKADVDRLYIPRRDGGRGLINLEDSYEIEKQALPKYLHLKQGDKYLGMVYRQTKKTTTEENTPQSFSSNTQNEPSIEQIKKFKRELKENNITQRKTKWRIKNMHGQIVKETEKPSINQTKSWEWLKIGELKIETEALITACQEQSVATKYLQTKIYKTGNDPHCRLCKTESETIHHILSGCPILAKKEYLERHNSAAARIHWDICREYGIKTTEKWFEHKPDPVVESEEITLIWDSQIQTDRFIKANKPDIVVKDKQKQTCLIIDVAVPSDYNITEKEAEKRLKYKDLQIEIERMWNMKTKIIPIIIGATGLVSNNTPQQLKEIPGNHNLASLQKTILLKTAHIVRKVL